MVQVVSLLVVIIVSYLGSVFFLPDLAARVDSTLGVGGFSQTIRAAKARVDSIGVPVATGATASGGLIDRTQAAIDQARALYTTTQERISESREFVDRKTEEFNTLMDSLKQAKDIADKLQSDLDALTSVSGSGTVSATGSANTEANLRALENSIQTIETLSGSATATGAIR